MKNVTLVRCAAVDSWCTLHWLFSGVLLGAQENMSQMQFEDDAR